MNQAIDRAIQHFGSMAQMARSLNLSSYTVIQQWRQSGRVPAEHCPKIERLLSGKIKCEELNDRVDWAFIRNGAAPNVSSSSSEAVA
jgi:DNA-binding transcriptional regulator YdaS (Cro superfamily)